MSKEEKIIINTYHLQKYLKGKVTIKEWQFPKDPFICDIYLEDNTILESKQLLNITNINGTIHIHSKNNCKVTIKLGLICNQSNNLEIINTVEKNNNNSEIRLRVVSLNDDIVTIKTTGIIEKQTTNNIFLEEVKVLALKKNNIICLPDLIVHSNDVIANHFVTMRCFKEEELFYLQSKGLKLKTGKDLLTTGFLQSMIK